VTKARTSAVIVYRVQRRGIYIVKSALSNLPLFTGCARFFCRGDGVKLLYGDESLSLRFKILPVRSRFQIAILLISTAITTHNWGISFLFLMYSCCILPFCARSGGTCFTITAICNLSRPAHLWRRARCDRQSHCAVERDSIQSIGYIFDKLFFGRNIHAL